ncbi:zinc-binding dehydrogenase [Micromonospora olivasterospora]|uniref:Putative PIG3 family NAD(P)H quinone oxidoreductase n=1 Tax=Micromonospora olivasterospora TaxID=1880 RepID=A0A562IBB0_MICOL|nr:zinc-binding dehydrogenase [Micromonospora olivasterospora]TWH68146.1 putative PIG3 family NAD(P)H quinone oxidoreductase [Micromonospora olivasterospora]
MTAADPVTRQVLFTPAEAAAGGRPAPPHPVWRSASRAAPAADQVLIQVHAAGLNRADLLQRDLDYTPPAGESAVPGLECAGTIAAIGPDVAGWQVGDQVCALLGSGGYASHALVSHHQLLPVPTGWTMAEAAALPEALATAWWNLRMIAGVRPGDRVLVHAANSGVGTTAVKVAQSLGATVAGTVRGPALADAVHRLGADPVVVSTALNSADELRRLAPDGFDVVLDLVGAAVADMTMVGLRTGGRWLSVGVLGGDQVSLSLRTVIRRRLVLTGGSLRSLPPAEKAAIIADLRRATPWAGPVDLRPVIAARYPAAHVAAALDHLERGGLIGKIVLTDLEEIT